MAKNLPPDSTTDERGLVTRHALLERLEIAARTLFDSVFGNGGHEHHARVVRSECRELLAACSSQRDLITQIRDDILAMTARHFRPGDSKSARFARAMRALAQLDEQLSLVPES